MMFRYSILFLVPVVLCSNCFLGYFNLHLYDMNKRMFCVALFQLIQFIILIILFVYIYRFRDGFFNDYLRFYNRSLAYVNSIRSDNFTIQTANKLKHLSLFEFSVLFTSILISIMTWFSNFGLSPDSTNYIVSSMNLIKHHHLFVYTNWPSLSIVPTIEPYTEYLPGFPYYISLFVYFIKDPNISMLACHSFSIVLFYISYLCLASALNLQPYYRIISYLYFAFFTPFSLIFSFFWSEPIFISLTLFTGAIAIKAVQSNKRIYWVIGSILLCTSSLIKYIGIFNILWFLFPILVRTKNRSIYAIIILFSIVVSPSLWLLRNKILFSNVDSTHFTSKAINYKTIIIPLYIIKNCVVSLGGITLIGVFMLLIITIIIVLIIRNSASIFSLSGRGGWVSLTLQLVFFTHFIGIWILSIFVSFDKLDYRLLSPTIALGLIALLNNTALYLKRQKNINVKVIIALIPFILLGVNIAVSGFKVKLRNLPISQPLESILWKDEKFINITTKSSFFYSDYNFRHQIYSNKPQRILLKRHFLKYTIDELINQGQKPFFVYTYGLKGHRWFEKILEKNEYDLKKLYYPEIGFIIYYQNEIK